MNNSDAALPGAVEAGPHPSPATELHLDPAPPSELHLDLPVVSEPYRDSPGDALAQPLLPGLVVDSGVAVPPPSAELPEVEEGLWIRMGREVMTGVQTLVSAA